MSAWNDSLGNESITAPECLDDCIRNLRRLRKRYKKKLNSGDAWYVHECAVEILAWMRNNRETLYQDLSYNPRALTDAVWELIGMLDSTTWQLRVMS